MIINLKFITFSVESVEIYFTGSRVAAVDMRGASNKLLLAVEEESAGDGEAEVAVLGVPRVVLLAQRLLVLADAASPLAEQVAAPVEAAGSSEERVVLLVLAGVGRLGPGHCRPHLADSVPQVVVKVLDHFQLLSPERLPHHEDVVGPDILVGR